VVVVGLAVTAAVFVDESPVAGVQLYVVAPLAVNTTLLPAKMVADVGFTLTVGNGFTVTVTVEVLSHPAPLVPVTRYVVVVAGFATTVAPVVEDKPVAGVHV
jgi:hypothetical protein